MIKSARTRIPHRSKGGKAIDWDIDRALAPFECSIYDDGGLTEGYKRHLERPNGSIMDFLVVVVSF